MVETHWEDVEGKELRYRDRTWKLTGAVDVRKNGELLAVEATRVDDVRHGTASLYFALRDAAGSLNPGNLGEHFDRLEREGDDQYLVVEKGRRSYRYELRRLEPG